MQDQDVKRLFDRAAELNAESNRLFAQTQRILREAENATRRVAYYMETIDRNIDDLFERSEEAILNSHAALAHASKISHRHHALLARIRGEKDHAE